MPRVKRGVEANRKHKKILKQAKGYYGARSRVFRVAVQAVTKAGQYAYRDRRVKKRTFRRLWITRINAQNDFYGLDKTPRRATIQGNEQDRACRAWRRKRDGIPRLLLQRPSESAQHRAGVRHAQALQRTKGPVVVGVRHSRQAHGQIQSNTGRLRRDFSSATGAWPGFNGRLQVADRRPCGPGARRTCTGPRSDHGQSHASA